MITKTPPALILYGLNEHGEPRAAQFDQLQAKSALKLAQKMGLNVLKVITAEHSALATQLEPGKLFMSGEGSVPKAPTEVYEKIVAAASAASDSISSSSTAAAEKGRGGQPNDAAPEGQREPETVQATVSASEPNADGTAQPKSPERIVVITGYPRGWDNIEVGSLVLAQASVEDGWWEAIVIEQEQDLFTLRWRDYPKEPKLVRHRLAIGLLAPVA